MPSGHSHFLLITSLPAFVISSLLINSCSHRCDVICRHGSDLHLHDEEWCWASFHVCIGCFFRKVSIHVLCLLLITLFVFCYWVVWFPYIFQIITSSQIHGLQIFSPIPQIALLFVDCFPFFVQKFFMFGMVSLTGWHFCCLCFGCHKNSLPRARSRSFSLMFSSRDFTVLHVNV